MAYTATLSQSQERSGWSVIFRHPVLKEAETGKPGKRIRRGLGTDDKSRAEALLAELNTLLSDEQYWEIGSKATASSRFDPLVVDIFYHRMTPEEINPEVLRGQRISLPTSSDSDYRRVQLLGTTGAGKTTLVRQLIGSHPINDRFPSTSTAKTTVADMELVLTDEKLFRAVVTFVGHDEARDHLDECISAAILAAYRGLDEEQISIRLLRHVNQRFRFNYVLGDGPFVKKGVEDDEDDVEVIDADASTPIEDDIDLDSTNELLRSVVTNIKSIAKELGTRLKKELNASLDRDDSIVEEIFEENLDALLRGDERFHDVADRLMDELGKRFVSLEKRKLGELSWKRGWPVTWYWESAEREDFIREINRFSSNYAGYFGHLLTPLVSGIRVSGPFTPVWNGNVRPHLVLIDGEGLGHTPASSGSLSTSLMKRFEDVDAILVVDNAQQPMQAAPVAGLRGILGSGNSKKLLICFTHFDAVIGDNLPTSKERERHVLASCENVLVSIGQDLGPFAERALRRRVVSGCFFVESIHQPIDPQTGRRTIRQLKSLLDAIDKIVEKRLPIKARPVYDKLNLAMAVKAATEQFYDRWEPILGLKTKQGIQKEHWTRIKALSRRLATGEKDEYSSLTPVADLSWFLSRQIYVMVQNPKEWRGKEPTEEEKEQIFDDFQQKLSGKARELAKRRLWVERMPQWMDAYALKGEGSTFSRAAIIAEQVYEKGAPIPDITPSPDKNKFLHEVVEVVEEAAKEADVDLA